ncbi:unnamed protein product [Rodentolepis nana]|uniref:Uncharacterized protein n=1 Tax=Rodentolepis nana TaxID=102285 RepID=A0A3P7S339_RODNA|nr:unnamed protein product [Rodentolepis nana]
MSPNFKRPKSIPSSFSRPISKLGFTASAWTLIYGFITIESHNSLISVTVNRKASFIDTASGIEGEVYSTVTLAFSLRNLSVPEEG